MDLWKLEMFHMLQVKDQMKTYTGSLQSWLHFFLYYCSGWCYYCARTLSAQPTIHHRDPVFMDIVL